MLAVCLFLSWVQFDELGFLLLILLRVDIPTQLVEDTFFSSVYAFGIFVEY